MNVSVKLKRNALRKLLRKKLASDAPTLGMPTLGMPTFGAKKISSCPICLAYGLDYSVWITDRKIKIGCQIHSTKAWENFTDEQIKKMDGDKALNFWKVWKEPILKLVEVHQNKGGEK